MTIKLILVVTCLNQIQFDGFSPISKHGYGTCNEYMGIHPEPIPKLVLNAENYFMLICHVILFDNYRVIKTTIGI